MFEVSVVPWLSLMAKYGDDLRIRAWAWQMRSRWYIVFLPLAFVSQWPCWLFPQVNSFPENPGSEAGILSCCLIGESKPKGSRGEFGLSLQWVFFRWTVSLLWTTFGGTFGFLGFTPHQDLGASFPLDCDERCSPPKESPSYSRDLPLVSFISSHFSFQLSLPSSNLEFELAWCTAGERSSLQTESQSYVLVSVLPTGYSIQFMKERRSPSLHL